MSDAMTFGGVTFTLDDLSQSDEYLRSVIAQHKALDGLDFCQVCCVRTPCDEVYMAASGLARSRDLAAAQSHADGLLLVVAELRAYMVRVTDMGTSGGGWIDVECLVCGATWFGAPDADQVIVHAPDCILAHAPETRAASLSAFVQASVTWAQDRGYLNPEYEDEDYPGDVLWTAMVDALRALAAKQEEC